MEVWCKTDKSQAMSISMEPQVLIIDNPESVVEIVSSVIGDDLIQLLTEQSNLH
jgi:ABC-type phosphate transport system ATPase subunit